MSIEVAGVLLTPLGKAAAGTEIRVIAQTSLGATLKGLEGIEITGEDGGYSFELVNGSHTIEINFSKEYRLVGEVTITDATPSPTTLAALLSM